MTIDETRDTGSLRVLLIEDEVSLRGPLAKNLEREGGYTVIQAAHAAEVRRLLSRAERPFDVALVDDLLAPDADEEPEYLGITLLREIRDRWSEVEVIIFTGWGMERALEALRAGAYRYLEKPVNLDELGMTIRMAAEQARLRQERGLLSAALEISNAMVSVADAASVLEVIAEAIPRLTGADACALALIDPLTGKVRHGPVVLLGDVSVKWTHHLRRGLLTRQIVEAGNPYSIADIDDQAGELDENLCSSGVRSFIGVPIPAGAHNLGVLYAYSLRPDAFGLPERQVLTLLARQAGIALENARLFDATRRASEELSALNRVVLEIGKELDRTALLRKIIERAVALLAAKGGGVYLLGPAGEHLTLAAAAGLPLDLEGQRIGKDEGLSGEILRTGEPQRVAEYYRSDRRLRILDAHELTGVAGAPIRAGDRTLGTLIVHDTRPGRQFDDAALALLQQVANHAGLAFQKAELLEKQRAIQHVSTAIASSRDLSEVLNLTCQAAVELFGVDHSGLVLFDRDLEWGTVEGEYPGQPNTLGERIPIKGVPAEERLASDKKTLVFSDVEEAKSELGPVLDMWRRLGIRSILIVPITYQNRVLGSFSLDVVGPVRQFTEEEVELCRVFAAHVAVAVENARLFFQLGETKERLDGLIASSLDAVIAIDRDERITVFSRATEEMCGWTAREMIGQTVARLHADIAKAREILDTVNRDGAISGWNVELKHRDGTPIPVLLSAALVRDSRGQPIGQAGFMRDLREIKLLEDRLRALIQVSQAITSTLELDEVLDLIVEFAVAVFPAAQKGSIHLCDERTGLLHIRASHGYSPEVSKALTLKVGEGRAGWVYEHAAPLVVSNVHEDERSKKIDCKINHSEVQEQKSAICVPLLVGDSAIGTVSLDNVTAFDAFEPEDLELLSIFASQAAVAILNAELMTKNRERVRKLEMLSRASNEMMSNLGSLGLDDRLSLILRHAVQILNAEAGSILLVRRPGFLRLEANYGYRDDLKGREFAIRSGKGTGLTGHIAYSIELCNLHGEGLLRHWAVAGEEPPHVVSGTCHSLLVIPLKRRRADREELTGLLRVENKKDKDGQIRSDIGFTEEDEWILSIFAETVVICLENAELYDRTSDRLEEKLLSLKAIQETSAAISAELDLDELLGSITERAARVFEAPAASLMLWDDREENLLVRAKYGLTSGYTQQRIPRQRVDAAIALMGGLRPLATVNLRSTPFGRLDLVEAEHLCSVLSAPLATSGRLIGILNIYSKNEPRQFTPDEMEVAEVLASQAAVAIRNAQLYEEKTRRTSALEALYEAGKVVTGTLALDEILSRIVEQAWRITGRYGKQAQYSDLALKEGNRLRFKAAYPPECLLGLQQGLGDIDLELDKCIGIKGRVVKTGRSQLVRDVAQDPDYIEYDPETRSELAVPIILGEEVIGVINVEHPDCGAFDEGDRRDLESLSVQAAIAIQNARLFREAERRALQLTAASEVARDAIAILDVERLLDETVCRISQRFGFYHAGVFLLDESREFAVPHAASSEGGRRMLERGYKLKVGEVGIVGFVTGTGKPRIALDVGKDAVHFTNPDLPDTRSEMAVPLIVRDQVIGALDVQSTVVDAFTDGDVATLQTMADQLANAIENARLYEKRQQEAKQLALVNRVAAEISSTLDLDKILQTLVDELARVIGVEQCAIAIFDESGRYGDVVAEYLEEGCVPAEGILIPLRNNPTIELVRKTKTPAVVKDAQHDPRMEKVWDIMKQRRTQSIMIVPIVIGDEVIGTIGLDAVSGPRDFTGEEVWLAETIAYHASIAIQNAGRYRELKRIKGLVGARTALAWMGMASSAWRHKVGNYATTIQDLADLARRDIAASATAEEIGKRLDRIEDIANRIQSTPITAPLQAEEGVRSVAVNELLRERIKQVWGRESYRNTHVAFDLGADKSTTVRASPDWLRRAIDILVDNAVESMVDSATRQLTISTQLKDGGVELTIRDTGKGVSDEVLQQLFQAPIPRPKGSKGLGVGLLMAHTIVQTYGGDIRLSSTGPSGTTMIVWLPIES